VLGRGVAGFTVDAGGTGVVFAAVSLDPWRFSAYVQNDHWDFAALNTVTYEDTETDLVNLAQAMASGRFDYDIIGYTVASQQVAAIDEQADAGASVGVVDTSTGMSSGVLRLWLLQQHVWSLRPYYHCRTTPRPVPGWGGPTYGWVGVGGCCGYYCNGSGYPLPPAVSYGGTVPHQKKSWITPEWPGAAVPSAGRAALSRRIPFPPAPGSACSSRPASGIAPPDSAGMPAGTSVAQERAGVEDDRARHEWLEASGGAGVRRPR
jgi:hypothetical protein